MSIFDNSGPSNYDRLANRVLKGLRSSGSAPAPVHRERPLNKAQQRSLDALKARMQRELVCYRTKTGKRACFVPSGPARGRAKPKGSGRKR